MTDTSNIILAFYKVDLPGIKIRVASTTPGHPHSKLNLHTTRTRIYPATPYGSSLDRVRYILNSAIGAPASKDDVQ